jgi:DNA (cytosine-5)-methyltransferase 1
VGEKLRFLDLFAGIGGFRLGLEQAGHKCIGFCEIDEFARQIYKANFDTEGEVDWEDITEVTDSEARELRGKVDLITAGFPCQAFSVAGKRRGFEDTRGTMFFEIARIAKQIEPRFLLLENVKGLLSHDKGRTFAIILSTLDELGYDVEWQVLNSKDFGVPQNRERVFIVGHSRRFPRREVFPITRTSGQALRELTHGLADAYRVYDPAGVARTLKAEAGGVGAKTGLYVVPILINRGKVRTKDDNLANCLDANYYRGLDNRGARTGIMEKPSHRDGVRIRRLTPLETFRLQGFPDSHHDNAKAAGVSDSQLYKRAGNAVTVNVVYEIARRFQND